MLVRIGKACAVNMSAIHSVWVNSSIEVTYTGGTWFSKGTKVETTKWILSIRYRDMDGSNHSLTQTTDDYQWALDTKNEVLSQVKELENAGATQALEEAIING
jgi:hypothetical protein